MTGTYSYQQCCLPMRRIFWRILDLAYILYHVHIGLEGVTFPDYYIDIERDCLVVGWKKVAQLVDPKYKNLVERNSRNVIGKTYRDNAIYELSQLKNEQK